MNEQVIEVDYDAELVKELDDSVKQTTFNTDDIDTLLADGEVLDES